MKTENLEQAIKELTERLDAYREVRRFVSRTEDELLTAVTAGFQDCLSTLVRLVDGDTSNFFDSTWEVRFTLDEERGVNCYYYKVIPVSGSNVPGFVYKTEDGRGVYTYVRTLRPENALIIGTAFMRRYQKEYNGIVPYTDTFL